MGSVRFFSRWSVGLALALALLVSVIAASTLKLSSNNRLFFSDEDAYYSSFLEFEDSFGTNSELVFLISCDQVCSDEQDSSAVERLESSVWKIRGVRGASSLFSFPLLFDDESAGYTITKPYAPECASTAGCRALRDVLVKKMRGRLISADERSYVVVATLHIDSSVADIVSSTISDIESVRAEFLSAQPSYSLAYTGAVPMMNAFFVASQSDLSVLMPLAMLVILLGLQVIFRDYRLSLMLIVHSSFAVLVTLGTMGFAGMVLNTATSTLPLVVITLVVATNMHIYVDALKRGVFGSESARVEVLRRVFGANWVPVSLATLTTVLGLASMLSVHSPPLRELGLWSAVGVMYGYIFAFVVAPTLFLAMGDIQPSKSVIGLRSVMNLYAKRIEIDKSHYLLLVFVVCFLLFGLSRVDVDENFVEYFPETSEFRIGAKAVEQALHSPYHIEIQLVSHSDSVLTLGSRELAGQLVQHLRGLPEVVNVLSLYDYLELIAQGLGVKQMQYERMEADAVEQLLLAFELGLEEGQSIDRFVSDERAKVRFSVLLRDVSMKDIRNLQSNIMQWSQSNPDLSSGGYEVLVTGEGLVTAQLSVESIRQMAVGVFFSLLFSGAIISYALRRVYLAFFLVFIAATTTLIGVSVWSVIVGSIGLSCTLVIAVTVGVVVDDAIHMLSRYSRGVDGLALSGSEAAAYSVHRAGPAIVSSTLVLCLGFAVLGLSEFAMNRDYGIGAAVVVFVALVFNMFVTPKLLSSRSP